MEQTLFVLSYCILDSSINKIVIIATLKFVTLVTILVNGWIDGSVVGGSKLDIKCYSNLV